MIFKEKSLSRILGMCCIFLITTLHAQDEPEVLPEESKFKDLTTKYWLNTYGNIRVSEKFFWVAQTHFRFEETKRTPFAGQLGQIYNRHALGYIYSEKINFSLGGVLRINFNTDEDDDEGRNAVTEWRIWHQYQFALPLGRVIAYHRLRIEHRWTQGFGQDSEFIFRNRWRYMFRLKVPLNSTKIKAKTIYVSPESEIILQSGKAVVDSPLEDLRLSTTVGYVISPNLTVAGGAMYNFGQDLNNGGIFKQGWTIRTHLYYSPDFRKTKNKLPKVHFRD